MTPSLKKKQRGESEKAKIMILSIQFFFGSCEGMGFVKKMAYHWNINHIP
jgi:hypothetical protein